MGARKAGDAEEFKALCHALRAPEQSVIRKAAIVRVRWLVKHYEGRTIEIAANLGVTERSVRRLLADLPEPVRHHAVTRQDVARIREMRKAGASYRVIGREIGISDAHVRRILAGKIHAEVAA